MKLYEIAEQYQLALRDLYDPETGEINENALALVNEIKDPMERKCINLVKFFKGLEAEAEAINAEKQRLAKRESSFNKQVDSLKDYLLMNMKNAQLQEVKSPEFVIKFKEDKASVDIYDENAVSEEYKKLEYKLDKRTMLTHMMNGVVIPGARLQYKPYLTIR
jgi:hypothetical protein